jgi:hypothetical protein
LFPLSLEVNNFYIDRFLNFLLLYVNRLSLTPWFYGTFNIWSIVQLQIVAKFAVKLRMFLHVSATTRQHAGGEEVELHLRWTTAVGGSFALKARVHIAVRVPGCEDIIAGMDMLEKRQ